jgi:hypothetical protein
VTAPLSEIQLLRHYVDEQDNSTYADAFLQDVIVRTGSLFRAASEVWTLKAARWARLVTTAEAGATKNLTDLRANALAMATDFKARADAEDAANVATGTGAPFVVDITR